MTDAASGSPCLVDPVVLLNAAREGHLCALVDGGRLALGAAARGALEVALDGSPGAQYPQLLGRLAAGEISVVSATAVELGTLASRDYRERLSLGEIEVLALVRSRGWSYCTEQPVVIGIMGELRLLELLVPPARLLSGGGLSQRGGMRSTRQRIGGRV